MKRCTHGKLKHPRGRRICRKAPRRGRRTARRSKRRSGGSFKVAGIGVLGLAAIGAGAYFIVPQLTA